MPIGHPTTTCMILPFPSGRKRHGPVPALSDVVRFPLERCGPTLDLVRRAAPDIREVEGMAEAFGLEPPSPLLRHEVDAAMTRQIAETALPAVAAARAARLEGMLQPLLTAAADACRAMEDARRRAAEAQQLALAARRADGQGQEALKAEAGARTMEAAEQLVEAHHRCEKAEGAARAVRLASRGEPWAAFDLDAEARLLFFGTGTGI
jgi:hypothetical protein